MTLTRAQFLMSCAGAAAAQDFVSSALVINVFVTVRDREGQLVRGLTREAFTLTDEGKKQDIRYFSAQSELPLTLGLLFDLSGSQRKVLDEQKRASDTFKSQLLRKGDEAFVVGFHKRAGFFKELPERVEGEATRGTALYDAIGLAAREAQAHAGRKAAVILSDGIDTASTASLDNSIEAAKRSDLRLYAVHVYDREVFRFNVQSAATDNLRAGKRALEKLARETGGSLLDDESLEANFARIGDELRNQYSLGYTPSDMRPGYHKLRVAVNQRGFTVQARDGYYAA